MVETTPNIEISKPDLVKTMPLLEGPYVPRLHKEDPSLENLKFWSTVGLEVGALTVGLLLTLPLVTFLEAEEKVKNAITSFRFH